MFLKDSLDLALHQIEYLASFFQHRTPLWQLRRLLKPVDPARPKPLGLQ